MITYTLNEEQAVRCGGRRDCRWFHPWFLYRSIPEAGAVVAPIQRTEAGQGSPSDSLRVILRLKSWKSWETQKRAEEHPEDKQVRIVLGNSYYDMGRFNAAVSWYQQALDLDPDNLNVRTDLGTAQLYQGKVSEAIETYQVCLKLDPNHPRPCRILE